MTRIFKNKIRKIRVMKLWHESLKTNSCHEPLKTKICVMKLWHESLKTKIRVMKLWHESLKTNSWHEHESLKTKIRVMKLWHESLKTKIRVMKLWHRIFESCGFPEVASAVLHRRTICRDIAMNRSEKMHWQICHHRCIQIDQLQNKWSISIREQVVWPSVCQLRSGYWECDCKVR